MTSLLINELKKDFPEIKFRESSQFSWSPQNNTIYFQIDSPNFNMEILHELGHALLKHKDFILDIELIQMEMAAWEYAKKNFSKKYSVQFNDDFIQDHLDTYRDWIHKRSLCPKCNINGYQQQNLQYRCPACGQIWKNNDSRFKQLQRRQLK